MPPGSGGEGMGCSHRAIASTWAGRCLFGGTGRRFFRTIVSNRAARRVQDRAHTPVESAPRLGYDSRR